MSAKLDLAGAHPVALEVNTNDLFGFFQRTLHADWTSSGRVTLLTRKISWWHQSSLSDFLSYCQREGREQRIPGLWALWVAWQVVLGTTVHSTAPAPGTGRASFRAPFILKLLMESTGAASPTLLTWQFGHYGSQTGAPAGTSRHLVLCRHRGRWSLFWRAWAYFFNHSFYITSFVYTHICYIK